MKIGIVEEVPSSWGFPTLEEIVEVNPKLDKSQFEDDLDVSFVPMPAVEAESGGIDVSESRKFSDVKKGYTAFQEKDVLFAKITPCTENGKMAVVPSVRNGLGFGSTEFHVLRSYSGISPQYVYYYVSSKLFRIEAEFNMAGAVGQRRVSAPWLSEAEIPLPPSSEQHRIVAKIEELFSELDKGIESLKTAREQLKVYRQALLKHAFEGKLTDQWRTENAGKLESADQLLERIKQEREVRYQQQLEEWKAAVQQWEANGREGKKPRNPKKPQPVVSTGNNEDSSDYEELPDGWLLTQVDSVSDVLSGFAFKSKDFCSEGVPVIKIANVSYGEFIEKTQEYLPIAFLESAREFIITPGDFLIALTRPITNNQTKVCEYPADAPFGLLNQRVACLKNIQIDEQYLLLYLSSVKFRDAIRSKFSETLQPNLSPKDLSATTLPLCSLIEQREVVAILDAQLSVLDRQEVGLEASLQQSEALRQSILKKAFSGQLVPQDPNDEPASVLLERIAKEKEEAAAKANKNKARKKSKTARTATRKAS